MSYSALVLTKFDFDTKQDEENKEYEIRTKMGTGAVIYSFQVFTTWKLLFSVVGLTFGGGGEGGGIKFSWGRSLLGVFFLAGEGVSKFLAGGGKTPPIPFPSRENSAIQETKLGHKTTID